MSNLTYYNRNGEQNVKRVISTQLQEEDIFLSASFSTSSTSISSVISTLDTALRLSESDT